MRKPRVCIVSPAAAAANNGNWHTAARWQRFLAPVADVHTALAWLGEPVDALIALHARRSADSIARFTQVHPGAPLAVVLTGTDLYRDIQTDPIAQRSLQLADRLVVLNELGAAALPAEHHAKTTVCLQSSPTRRTLPKTGRHLRALMVGHLRDEKSPRTYYEAARRLAARPDILLDHIGSDLDPAQIGRAHV